MKKQLLNINNIKEGMAITLEKVYGYNLVGTNSESLDENDIHRTNVRAFITRIDLRQNGVWTEQGWHITDLINAGLVTKRYCKNNLYLD